MLISNAANAVQTKATAIQYKVDALPHALNASSDEETIPEDKSYTFLAGTRNSQQVTSSRDKTIFYKVKPGDSIATIFNDLGLDSSDLHKILHNRKLGKQFANLAPGRALTLRISPNNELLELSYKKDDAETYVASRKYFSTTRNYDDFSIKIHSKPLDVQYATAHVVIRSSLSKAAKNAGLPSNITQKLADIFAWDIDLAQNLKQNDQFTVVYEQLMIGNKIVDTGDIVSAEFINQGHVHQAVRYIDKEGNVNYYTPNGEGMRKTFLTTPLDFAKISSGFSLHRRHPILNRIRAHKGVDYAASTGTPVKVTGDGKIVYQGVKGGYGQVIMVDHGQGYSTLYAHLSNFQRSLSNGDIVKQGQVIGYVGQTGLATGPHLHYEFMVDGVNQNPLSAKAASPVLIDKSLLAHFKTQTRPLLAQLEEAKTTMLAGNLEEEIDPDEEEQIQ